MLTDIDFQCDKVSKRLIAHLYHLNGVLMPLILQTLFIAVAILILLCLILKIIVLKAGKAIRANLFSFFWFSQLQIANSSYSYSKRKRIVMNQLSRVLFVLLAIEFVIILSYLWIRA